VSRGRKTKRRKNFARRPYPVDEFGFLDECDCPGCAGAFPDPPELIDGLIGAAADLVVSKDPLDAEMVGASFLALGALTDDGFLAASVDVIIQEFEARANPEALALLLAIGSVADGATGRKATAAAERLSRAGVRRPAWTAELRAPVTVGDCWCLTDSEDTGSMLACTFSRAGRSHAVVIAVDHTDCGAADEILQFEADILPAALDMMRAKGRNEGLEITTERLDPAEFRWQVEKALDARACMTARTSKTTWASCRSTGTARPTRPSRYCSGPG
jgi:hypothetical protein